jgi:hypothetical protein
MLPLGRLGPHPGAGEPRQTRFTNDEQRAMMTLWAIFRSPLMMGGDLPSSDKWTESLLTNPEVIAVNQHSRENRAVTTTASIAVWTALPEDGTGHYVAFFNIGDSERAIHYTWKDLGLAAGTYRIRDLWERKNLESAQAVIVKLRPHAAVMYRVRKK